MVGSCWNCTEVRRDLESDASSSKKAPETQQQLQPMMAPVQQQVPLLYPGQQQVPMMAPVHQQLPFMDPATGQTVYPTQQYYPTAPIIQNSEYSQPPPYAP